jgi:NADH-quinone oxidoreductase subunit H
MIQYVQAWYVQFSLEMKEYILSIDPVEFVSGLGLILANFLIFLVFVLLAVAITTLLERKLLSSMQRRRGPNVVGILGFLQPFADALKLVVKEHVFPRDADKVVFVLATVFTFFCSLKIWAALPLWESDSPIYVVNGVLYILIILSFSAYGLIFAGWSSNSKYAFLGGLRSTAQMISYEVCISFIFVLVVTLSQSLDLREIVEMQSNSWYVCTLFPVWVVFFVCALAETNRAPFDLPEAEAELVAGYNVEYSAIPFALFFLAEYANIVASSVISSLLFFGGWLPIISISWLGSPFWLTIKVVLNLCLFIWVRATLPRYRYDQLMKLGWKILLPMTLFFLFFFVFIFMHLDLYVLINY